MSWMERMQRLERKHCRQVIRENVRAYRKRKADAGFRRIEALLTFEQHAKLLAQMQHGETLSQAIGRMLCDISGNKTNT